MIYLIVFYIIYLVGITVYQSRQVDAFDVSKYAQQLGGELGARAGAYKSAALAGVTEKLLDKPGGIVSNDVFFPGVWLDDMPNWERGVVIQLRQILGVFNEKAGNSSIANQRLAEAQELLNVPLDAWPFPSSQAEYEKALEIFKDEFKRINEQNDYSKAKATNDKLYVVLLKAWLKEVDASLEKYNNLLLASAMDRNVLSDVVLQQSNETRGLINALDDAEVEPEVQSLSLLTKSDDAAELLDIVDANTKSISASKAKKIESDAAKKEHEEAKASAEKDVAQNDIDKPGKKLPKLINEREPSSESVVAEQNESPEDASEPDPQSTYVQTSWLDIDDVFYQSRGYSWALLHFLKAFEQDHRSMLKRKSKQAALKIALEKLEAAQEPLWSPMVLNGKGMGILANHSLVLASHLTDAQEALASLRKQL